MWASTKHKDSPIDFGQLLMTCTLILMRHSYAADENSHRDFDRPLTDHGVSLADSTGQLLRDLNIVPQLIVTSSAVRTVTTARHVATQFDPSVPQVHRDDLYQAGPSCYLPAVQSEAAPDVSSVLAIGHNPGMSSLICGLAGERLPVPPATVGVFSLDAEDWFDLTSLSSQTATLTHLIVNGQLENKT